MNEVAGFGLAIANNAVDRRADLGVRLVLTGKIECGLRAGGLRFDLRKVGGKRLAFGACCRGLALADAKLGAKPLDFGRSLNCGGAVLVGIAFRRSADLGERFKARAIGSRLFALRISGGDTGLCCGNS